MNRFRPFLLSIVLAVATNSRPTAAAPVCSRIVAVGDLHGGFDAFVRILTTTKLIDDSLRLTDSRSCLVQTGDAVDRGPHSRDILDLLMRLQREAPDRVFALLGNHEVLNLLGDLRYIHPAELAAFRRDEDGGSRDRLYAAFRRSKLAPQGDEAATRLAFDARHPVGWLAHRHAFSSDGTYGRWLMGRPALVIIDRTLFVHGGIELADARVGIEELNGRIRRELATFGRLHPTLIDEGWIEPFMDFRESMLSVDAHLGQGRYVFSEILTRNASQFLALRSATISRPDGPLWSRELALADERVHSIVVTRILDTLDIDRIVVAHTTRSDHSIAARFDGRVFIIDTGSGPAYGGRPSALEIRPDDGVFAVYETGTQRLVDLSPNETAGDPAAATR